MTNISGQSSDHAEGHDNKEMNSSDIKGGSASSDSEPHIEPSETEGKGVNPGRTPGKAEGVEDAEERGNQ